MYFMSSKAVPTHDKQGWTFLSNHTHVLICIAQQPDVRLSDVAQKVGVSERAVHRIVHELIDEGYLSVTKEGRCNVYEIDLEQPLRHPLESHHHIRAVVSPFLQKSQTQKKSRA